MPRARDAYRPVEIQGLLIKRFREHQAVDDAKVSK
jgi:hypothetical protein